MFTGIITAVSPIISLRAVTGGKYLSVKRPADYEDIKIGSSIACDGICLTVLKFDPESFTVQIMNETLAKTSAGGWKNGEKLNLEQALKIGDRLDGHWVMGHVDRAVKFLRKESRSGTGYYHFELPAADRPLMIPQGSIAINGVSLTVAGLTTREFSVALIEHTSLNSNIPLLRPGSLVNLEYDALGKYILRKDL